MKKQHKLIKQEKGSKLKIMNEKIDILVATYNGEKYIKEQIESLLRSNLPKHTNNYFR